MYVVEIFDADGDPAEFVVADPVVVLDLVLRAERTGLPWQVLEERGTRSIHLEDIRHRALTRAAADTTASEQLHRTYRDHDRAVRAALN